MNKQKTGLWAIDWASGKKRYGTLYIAAVLLILGGLWMAKESGQRTDAQMRRDLARIVMAVAAAVPPEEAELLSFTESDLLRPEFKRLSGQLKAYAEAVGLRSLYTMALRDGQLVFGPENLDPDDLYASSPGEVYQNPALKDFEIFQTGEAMVQGPASDEYGIFVTATAPVINPHTDKVMMTVGIDVEASRWKVRIRKAQLMPLLIVAVPLAVLTAGWLLMKLRPRFSPELHHPLRHTEAVICSVIMTMLTVGISFMIHRNEERSRLDTFYSMALLKGDGYSAAIGDMTKALYSLSSFYASSEYVSQTEFSAYCRNILQQNSIQACFWLPEVPDVSADMFIQQAKAEGLPDFSIRPIGSKPPEAKANVHYPAFYIESQTGHGKSLGYDLYSEPQRRAAIDKALQTGLPSATDPIRLAVSGIPNGIDIFTPVATLRQKGLVGFVIRPDMMIASLGKKTSGIPSGLSVSLYELNPGIPPYALSCLNENCPRNCWNPKKAELHQVLPVFAFGKAYGLLIVPEPRWIKAHPLSEGRTALITGLLLTCLMTALITILSNRPAVLERLIRERTAELHESEERFSLAASTAGIGVWDRNVSENRLVWDSRMYRLYGVKPEKTANLHEVWERCVHPDDLHRVSREIATAEREGKEFSTEFRIIRPDGKIRNIQAFGKVIRDPQGIPLRMLGINYDITEQKTAQQRIQLQLEELSRWHRITLGRETRILELKKEINALLQLAGQPPRYEEGADSQPEDSGI